MDRTDIAQLLFPLFPVAYKKFISICSFPNRIPCFFPPSCKPSLHSSFSFFRFVPSRFLYRASIPYFSRTVAVHRLSKFQPGIDPISRPKLDRLSERWEKSFHASTIALSFFFCFFCFFFLSTIPRSRASRFRNPARFHQTFNL